VVAGFMLSAFMYSWDEYLIYPAVQEKLAYSGPSANRILTTRGQLILANSHVVTHPPQPYLQNVIQVHKPSENACILLEL
jgi:hypothetical protein